MRRRPQVWRNGPGKSCHHAPGAGTSRPSSRRARRAAPPRQLRAPATATKASRPGSCPPPALSGSACGVLSRELIRGHGHRGAPAPPDFRAHSPRFRGHTPAANPARVDALRAVAASRGATPAAMEMLDSER